MLWRWRAPCSIPRTAWPGWGLCALHGAGWRSTTCTGSPAPTMPSYSPGLCRSCWPSACRCSASRAAAPPGACSMQWLPCPRLRASQPTATPGTWLEQVWLRLGGAACVDATARANVDLLWSCLDNLPGGELDLPGPALDAALDKLNALPDPEAGSDFGVQLMTIHKSKGLEFEVVIVPELQAGTAKAAAARCSPGWSAAWPNPTNRERLPNFSSRPSSPKAQDRGEAKEWVDRMYSRTRSAGGPAHPLRGRHPRPRRTAPLRPPRLQDGQ